MAVTPGTYNMTIQRSSDHSVQLVFNDSSCSAINLTGYTIEAQVWEETRQLSMQIGLLPIQIGLQEPLICL